MAEGKTAAPNVRAGLATPFWLPASHFSAGLFFFLAAAWLAPLAAVDLAAGRFLQPRVVALTHLITLGWLTMSIMGALCQLFPVVLGTPLRWPKLSLATLILFVPGLIAFVAGLLTGFLHCTIAGAASFATALLLFIINASATLKRAPRRDMTWWALALGIFFLLVTITFGGSLALNLETGHLQARRLQALAVHVHVALGGWVLLVIIAVARRVLPMFLLSHGASERPLRIAIIAAAIGAATLALFHRAMTHALFLFAASWLALAACAVAVQVFAYARKRHRPKLDPGLQLVLAATVLLVAAVALGLAAALPAHSMRTVTAYGVSIVVALALFVAGHYYKILPFLLWNHRFAPLVGKQSLPKIADLFDARIARAAVVCLTLGASLLICAILFGATTLATIAAALISAGATIQCVQLATVLRMRAT